MKAYLINLDRAPERLAAADAQLRAAGVAYERLPALDGRALGWGVLDPRVSRFRFTLVHGRPPSLGAAASTLSHHEAYRRLLAAGEPAALIFEDDVTLDPARFRRALDLIRSRLDPAKPELFLLCDHEGETPPTGEGIVPTGPRTACAEAYVITAAAARRFLTLNEPIHAILDAWGLWTRRGFAIWKVYPPAATQADVPSISHAATAESRRARWGWYIVLWRARLALTRALDALLYKVLGR